MNTRSAWLDWRVLSCLLPVTLLAMAAPAQTPTAEPHLQILALLKTQNQAVTKVLPDLHPKRTTFNAEAPIPPQCYTRTENQFNPCYVCHQNHLPGRENTMNDGGLQLEYAFSDVGMTNHWKNLFEDRSQQVAAISDDQIIAWVNTDNYSPLAPRLRREGFGGWIPDLSNLHLGAEAFDDEGFALDGSGWVAFNYKPLPSTFWPTNGSTDDVMIRMEDAFRQDSQGLPSREVYKANLAILEARIKGLDRISSLQVDEQAVGTDLNGDGELTSVSEITKVDQYVGNARGRYRDSFVYPQGTEFLHTVRYVAVDGDEVTGPSTRMKEVRYMRKWREYGKQSYAREYELENFAKEAGRLPRYVLLGDHGLDNGFGWSVSGFIEDAKGDLRTLTYEENLFCMGCHSSIGATIDKTFAFPRKVDGKPGWRYIDLKGMPDAPSMGEQIGEIETYLHRVGGGGEFRSNPEMYAKWFTDGKVDAQKIDEAKDVYDLIVPSVQRALELNKAYRVIVADQDLHSLLGPADEKGLHHGVPILANSATTLVFNQKASELARVRNHFPDLPEALVQALPTMRQGTCIAQLPGDLLQVSVIPSPFELTVLSSRLQDREQAKKQALYDTSS